MSEPKTKMTDASVDAFIDGLDDERKRDDSRVLVAMMREVSGEEPRMWGESIVGFGRYTYRYKSGHSGDWPLVAFSPRKQNLTIYVMPGFERYAELLPRLGKHKTSVGCLYLKRLSDVDQAVLREIVRDTVETMRAEYPPAD